MVSDALNRMRASGSDEQHLLQVIKEVSATAFGAGCYIPEYGAYCFHLNAACLIAASETVSSSVIDLYSGDR